MIFWLKILFLSLFFLLQEKTEIKDNKSTHEVTKEVKDPRSLGEKLTDAKDAFTGK